MNYSRLLKILYFTLLLIPTVAMNTVIAEPLPFGCYVTDLERSFYEEPPSCYNLQESTFSHLTPANTSAQGLIDAYGQITASFIVINYQAGLTILECAAEYDKKVNLIKRKVSLIKRLRRACGENCKKIK